MTDEQWRYLTQLIRALDEAGVRGDRIGELVAELATHLEQDDFDPVEEFGAPFHMARELAGDESLVPRWVRTFAVKAVSVVIAMIGAALAVAAMQSDPTQVTVGLLANAVAFGLLIIVLRSYLARRLDGRSLASIVTPGSIALLLGGSVVVMWLSYSEILIATWSRPIAIVIAVGFIVAGLGLARLSTPPIRFPDHAQHLRPLRQLGRRQPASR